ncbi:adenosylhomocysteinase [Ignicoccus hospitalis]|uniref:Adenosylhomocysteinase n=1 Tax=Ignicoccus hospitalis (strain KIN4/I / DSM 18386 / JCM 14125) TaxID=453591 RepID=A8A8H2_IGNH4|nr:adenosylhomocysteinase [Ignicoccus hospitalis]ABU81224.1 adenosylhomocysteinase [Ignicoccus hospitalis KIN4/I]HIH90654.1 adenosylhomocysteinase [Desulfurococcaceae archaeon]
MGFKVKDISLADQGKLKIEWAENHMPVVVGLRKLCEEKKVFEGKRISAVLHVTKETAALVRSLKFCGAEVYLAGSNPLSTQDDVAAALAQEGINVYAWKGETEEEYWWAIKKIIEEGDPDLVIDDGGDLHATIHKEYPKLAEKIIGGTEETTTGVIRLKAMEKEGVLKYPVIAVNDAFTKFLFDNRYGTGQSTIDGILRATNILLAGKVAVVAGYGWVGRGIAMRLRGMGARVVVTEVNPLRALEAVHDGFDVMRMDDAAKIGDLFVTATGNIHVIRKEHILKMKDGAILANAGHFNVEIDVKALEEIAISKRRIRPYVDEYKLPDGRRIYLLAEGRLVNLVAAEGHPSEVMDMSFANQFLSLKYLLEKAGELAPKVYKVPAEIDEEVARRKLEAMGIKIDSLTEEQVRYLNSW